jgi:hypothetical protein
MTDLIEPSFDASEEAILDQISSRLRAQGWAKHVTVESLLRDWQKLSVSVDRYPMVVEDYLNDLTARDGLEIVLADCPEVLRPKVEHAIGEADKEFFARTQADLERTLERCFRIDELSGWWWRRRPAAGPLAEFLTKPSTA